MTDSVSAKSLVFILVMGVGLDQYSGQPYSLSQIERKKVKLQRCIAVHIDCKYRVDMNERSDKK